MSLTNLPARVTPLDLAHATRRSVVTVRQWIKKGWLPAPERLSYHFSFWERERLLPHLALLFPGELF